MKKNDRVKVDFVSESRTEFSGNHFTGEGVVDRVEDGRVFGQLDDGTPFMCAISDVVIIQQQVIEGVSLQEFERIYEPKEHFKYLKFYPDHNFFNYTEDSPRGAEACHSVNASYQMYINRQAVIDDLQKRVDVVTHLATELAEYASYAEIIGAVSHNRKAIREYCDKIFAHNRVIDLEEEEALRGESQ